MSVQILVDEALLEKALELGGTCAKGVLVTDALKEYVARREKAKLPELFGLVEFVEGYDYAKLRRRG